MKKVYLIATFIAILTGFATYLFVSSLQPKPITGVKTYPVVVAVVPIPENTVITQDMIAIKQVIDGAVATNAVTKLEDALGYLNKYPVSIGEQIISTKIFKIGKDQNNAALSYQLKAGEYAYTIPVDSVAGVSGFISKGDYVDIIYTTADNGKLKSKLFMKKVHVIKVSTFAANSAADVTGGTPITSYSELVLNLTKDQVLALTEALANGRITLALEPIATNETTTTQTETTSQAVSTTQGG